MTPHRILLGVGLLGTAIAGCISEPFGPGSSGVLSVFSGNGQVWPVNSTLPAPLVVQARFADGGTIAGLEVTWKLAAAAGPGASLSSTTAMTDANGLASVRVTLGTTVGGYLVQAAADGRLSAEFVVIASTVDFGVSVESGSGQVGVTGSVLPQPLVAQLIGPDGTPSTGVEVTFMVLEGAGASVSPATVMTAGDGTAATTLTLGESNGKVRVSASGGSGSVEFVNWACGGDATDGFLSLAVGADTTVSGADIGCIQFDALTAGAAYEVVVTPTNTSLIFNPIEVFLAASSAGSPRIAPAFARGQAVTGAMTDRRLRLGLRYDWDGRLRELERSLLPGIRERAVRGGFALADVPVVGDTLDFAFSCVSQVSFPGTPTSITGVVTEVSSRAVIVEDTVGMGSFTATEYQEIGRTFDDVIFATDTTYFGSPADIDANGDRVVLLFTAGVNTMSDVNPNGYDDGIVAGFFCPTDISSSGGNQAEMFYLVMPDPTGEFTTAADVGLTKEEVLAFTNGTVAHEFQHLINAQTGLGGAFDVWLNEGLSHLAEEVVGHAATGLTPGSELTLSDYDGITGGIEAFNTYQIGNWFNLAQYVAAPSDTAGLVMASDPFGPATFRLRGTSWSFVRYLLDRFETGITEPVRTRALLQSAASDARDAIAAVFGVPFESLVSDWAIMLAVEDRSDVVPRAELQLRSYRLRDMFAELGLRSSAFPLGGYPLVPTVLDLAVPIRRAIDLFSYTGDYLRLESPSGAGPAGIRLGNQDTADDIATALGVRVVIVRTN